MRRLATTVLDSVVMFTKTAQFDARGIVSAWAGKARALSGRGRKKS